MPRLTDLDLTKVDRVTAGSNPGSKIVLFKSQQPVAKMGAEDTRNRIADAIKPLGGDGYVWVVDYDLDTMVAVFDDDGIRRAVSLARAGDTFVTVGDPYDVKIEYTPIDKTKNPTGKKGDGDMPFDMDQLDDDARAAFEALTAERDEAVAKAEQAEQALNEATTEPEVDEAAEFMKSAPEAVRKAFEEAEQAKAEVAKMRDEQNTARFIAKAKSDYGHDGDTASEVASVLKSVAASEGEDSQVFKSLDRVLKAAAAQHEKAMETLGKAQGHGESATSDDAGAQIRSLVQSYQIEKGCDFVTAHAAITKAHPDLIAQYNRNPHRV